MFAYCNNNPIIAIDENGEWFHIVVGAVVGGISSFISSVVTDVIAGNEVDWCGAAISAGTGAAAGALVAAFPACAGLISAGASATESVIDDLRAGSNLQTTVTNATISAGFGYFLGSAGSSNAKLLNEAGRSIPQALKGNHPLVRKGAKKVIKKAAKTILKSLVVDTAEGVSYGLVEKGTKVFVRQIVKCYALQVA